MDKRNKRKSKGEDDSRFSHKHAEARAKIREDYGEAFRKLCAIDPSRGAEHYGAIREVTDQADQLIVHKSVTPREMRLDAKLVKKTAKVFDQILEGIRNKAVDTGKKVDVEDYAVKLCHKMIGNRWTENKTSRSIPRPGDWVAFSTTAKRSFKSPLTWDGRTNYLQNLGIFFHDGPTEPPVTPGRRKSPKKTLAQRPQGPAPKPTRMLELRAKDMDGDEQNMRRRMDICKRALKEAVRANRYQPVHYLKFVADPTSYENTVRNMFSLSFLINRLDVSLFFDSNDQPHIYFEKDKARIKRTDGDGEVHVGNWIASITPAEWTQIVNTYDIKEAMINPAGINEDLPDP